MEIKREFWRSTSMQQIENFRTLAREHACDEGEERADERVRKIAAPNAPKPSNGVDS